MMRFFVAHIALVLSAMVALGAVPKEAVLHVQAGEGHSVRVDGAVAGKVGAEGLVLRDLAPGQHKVEIWMDGVRTGFASVSLQAGEVTTVVLAAREAIRIVQEGDAIPTKSGGEAVLTIRTIPADCEIDIPGVGVTKQRKTASKWQATDLPVGEVEVLLRRGQKLLSTFVALDEKLEATVFADFLSGEIRYEQGARLQAEGFVEFKPGAFTAGSLEGSDAEQPVDVRVERPFWLSVREVTVGDWRTVMGEGDRWAQDRKLDENEPIAVPQQMAIAYVKRLGEMAGDPELYRLPTEVEWAYAANRGLGGGTPSLRRVRCAENSLFGYEGASGWKRPIYELHRVGSLSADASGLHDILGSRAEWCAETYAGGVLLALGGTAAKPGGSHGVVRGGAFDEPLNQCTTWRRKLVDLGASHGFRVAANRKPKEATK